ncbi:hypothetical protein [Tenacibaculum geojense]|uniref:Uncharacterized protein n=1 Tax=Tenacibaculum geojense TaxID=915352 RepID=A0ABW3JU65_9FLAO
MRKGILFLLLSVLTLASVEAKTTKSKIGVNYRYNDAVTFIERGIEFHVFLNGDFDFDTHYRNNRYNRRYSSGIRIERDYNGRVRRVGNVFINYDRRGNVKRIGSVYMKYRYGNLSKIGNLFINYDKWGYPNYRGYVKERYNESYFNIDVNIGPIYDYDDRYFYREDFRNNYRQFREDNDYFYYRAALNARVGKNKIIKRKKPKNRKIKKYKEYKKEYYLQPEQKGRSKRDR